MPRQTGLLLIMLASSLLTSCDRRTSPANRAPGKVAATGEVCGGTARACSSQSDFCKKPEGECSPDAQGTCTPRPAECPYNNDPVCGCDGKTYSNACFADAAGVTVRAAGACAPEQPQGVPLTVRIVPEIREGGVTDYCRLADRPGGKDLIVRLRNPTPLAKPALAMSVGFAGTPPSTATTTSPAIAGASTVDVRVPVPNSCLTGDCRFLIKVQDPAGAVQAEGNCLG